MKFRVDAPITLAVESSPARGTWIEMRCPQPHQMRSAVVPRTGDVD